MKIMIYVLANRDTGLGHWYRCIALQDIAEAQGHAVILVSDKPDLRVAQRIAGPPTGPRIAHLMTIYQPDWLVLDLPFPVADYIPGMVHSYKSRVASLLSCAPETDGVDVLWRQDNAENIILRPNLFADYTKNKTKSWFVFGGATDPMGLLPAYSAHGPAPATLITSGLAPCPIPRRGGINLVINPDRRIFEYMRQSSRACVAFGMIAWELAALGIPTYLFSLDDEHLNSAIRMQESGLARTYPKTGIPEPGSFVEFLDSGFRPNPKSRPDGLGGARFLKRLSE